MSYTLAAVGPVSIKAISAPAFRSKTAAAAAASALPSLPPEIRAKALDDLKDDDKDDDKGDNTKLIAGVAVAGLVAYFLLK